jgi:putative membrane protein
MGFFLRLIACALGVAAAAWLLQDIEFTGRATGSAELNEKVLPVMAVALILTAVNAIVRPLVKIFTFPLVVLTLGVFMLVINAWMLLLTDAIASEFELGFTVDGFLAAALGSLVITVITWGVDIVLGNE